MRRDRWLDEGRRRYGGEVRSSERLGAADGIIAGALAGLSVGAADRVRRCLEEWFYRFGGELLQERAGGQVSGGIDLRGRFVVGGRFDDDAAAVAWATGPLYAAAQECKEASR